MITKGLTLTLTLRISHVRMHQVKTCLITLAISTCNMVSASLQNKIVVRNDRKNSSSRAYYSLKWEARFVEIFDES